MDDAGSIILLVAIMLLVGVPIIVALAKGDDPLEPTDKDSETKMEGLMLLGVHFFCWLIGMGAVYLIFPSISEGTLLVLCIVGPFISWGIGLGNIKDEQKKKKAEEEEERKKERIREYWAQRMKEDPEAFEEEFRVGGGYDYDYDDE